MCHDYSGNNEYQKAFWTERQKNKTTSSHPHYPTFQNVIKPERILHLRTWVGPL